MYVHPALFSDGQSVCSILPHEDAFSIQTIFRPQSPTEDTDERTTAVLASSQGADGANETLLKLTKKSMLVYGHGVIADISKGDIASKQPQAQAGVVSGAQQPQPRHHQPQSKQPSTLQQDDSRMPIVLCKCAILVSQQHSLLLKISFYHIHVYCI